MTIPRRGFRRLPGILPLAALSLVLLLSAACGGDDDDAEPTPTQAPESTATVDESAGESTPADSAEVAAYPVTIDNCGFEVTINEAPARAISMNQGATEIMLALGLEDRMIGTAYLDDAILPDYQDAYETVPVLAEEYPSQEVVLGEDPDFVYGSYASAFGAEGAGPRDALADLEIGTYVSPAACEDVSLRPEQVSFDTVFAEIRDIGAIFGVSDRAEQLVNELQADLDEATDGGQIGDGYTAIWYDSGTEAPLVGGCCGAPGMIMRELGIDNAFGEAAGAWADGSWEEFVNRDPDFLVLVDASWDTAEGKKEFLAGDPATQTMSAVAGERYVGIPFSAGTPGIRNVTAVVDIAGFIRDSLD